MCLKHLIFIQKAYSVSKIKEQIILNDEFNNNKILVTLDTNIETTTFELNPIQIFNREINSTVLEFEEKDNKLLDKQTQSEWNFDGVAISGSYSGQRLQQIPAKSAMWFSWLSTHPMTELYY